jgi:sulfate permease, SulP family
MVPREAKSAPTVRRKDLAAGAIAAIVSLPVCLASGLLAFAPLGPDYAAMGAAAGLCGAIVTCCVSALFATSSFVVTTSRVSEALLLASLTTALLAVPAVASDKNPIVVAMFLCVSLAGLWQTIFGLAGFARVIKFTPHPVLVGFLNGVSVLVVMSQLKPYFLINPGTSTLAALEQPLMFVLLIGTAALMLGFPAVARHLPVSSSLTRVPPVIVAFAGGILGFYLLKAIGTGFNLGPTVGDVRVIVPSSMTDLSSIDAWRYVIQIPWLIISTSAVLAIIATLDSLLALRAAQNVTDLAVSPVRDLVAQGIGNCAAGLAGGIAGAASPSSTMAAYRAGGRTRLVAVSCGLLLLAVSVLAPQMLASIPSVVLAGILLATGILLFDRSVFGIVTEVRRTTTAAGRRRSLNDFGVIVIVMFITVFYSLVAGVVTGVVLAGMIFIINMSRPIVERVFLGHDIQSKRIRPTKDVEILLETGQKRAVLLLEGVLFFGNADDLSAKVKQLFLQADMVTLDMRGVSDIDVSGANILASLANKSRAQSKYLLFCGVSEPLYAIVKGILPEGAAADVSIQRDLDAALEWMEEASLQLHAERRGRTDALDLRDIDFLSGLATDELERLGEVLTKREFSAGDTICREGEEGDRMWLLAKGSVSVRHISADGSMNLRIASLSRGTTIGEMALIEQTVRSATIVADEHVVGYELLRDGYVWLLSEYPAIATKLLSNLARELARRLRRTSQDLRNRT